MGRFFHCRVYALMVFLSVNSLVCIRQKRIARFILFVLNIPSIAVQKQELTAYQASHIQRLYILGFNLRTACQIVPTEKEQSKDSVGSI